MANLFDWRLTRIVTDLPKEQYNRNRRPQSFFWRDKTGHEIGTEVHVFKHVTVFGWDQVHALFEKILHANEI